MHEFLTISIMNMMYPLMDTIFYHIEIEISTNKV